MIPCPKCGVEFRLKEFLGQEVVTCRYCSKDSVISYFPALFKPFEKGVSAEQLIEDTEASCYNHQSKKAVASCASCGIYVCALCEIAKGDKKLCSNCFNQNVSGTQKDDLIREYVQYSSVASSILVFSFLIWPLSIILGPFALIYSIKFFNKPEGFFRGTRKVHVITNIVISSLVCVGWVVLGVSLFLG